MSVVDIDDLEDLLEVVKNVGVSLMGFEWK